jgi:hypothetical protein
MYSHFASLWLQSPACFPLRPATHFPPLILSALPSFSFLSSVFPCIHIFHCIYTYYNEECSRSDGLALFNQLFPMIKKYNESNGTLISSLITWLFSAWNAVQFIEHYAKWELFYIPLFSFFVHLTCLFSCGKVFNILSRALEVETAEIAHWDLAFIWFRNAKEKWTNCLLFYVLFISRCQLFISLLGLNWPSIQGHGRPRAQSAMTQTGECID